MAAEIQSGTAVIHGITNSGSAITLTGFATFLFDTVSGVHQFKLIDTADALGFDANSTAVNANIEVDLDFKPSGATRAAAAAVAVFIAPLAAITLANFKVSAFNGTYVYRGNQKIELKADGPAKITIPKIRQYSDGTQNSSMTGGPISG